MQRTLWHAQLAAHLARLFAAADPALLAEIEANAEWLSLRGGECLFRRGEPGDAAYIVISGRVRIVDGERTLNEVGPGETLGEMALLSGEPRSASVYAVRDTLLARLAADAFSGLVERHPAVLRRIAGHLVERLRGRNGAGPRAAARTFAIVPATAGVPLAAFAEQLGAALAAHGATLRVAPPAVERALGRPGAAEADDDDAEGVALIEWLNEQELAHRFVLYEAAAASRWSARALRQADHVLLLAAAGAALDAPAAVGHIAARSPDFPATRTSLVVLRATGTEPTRGAAPLLERCPVAAHYHAALDAPEDFARIARCLTGQGIGLVLGGGGARGFAHLGVLRSLAEAGVPVDWVGGTSIGAIIAALAAAGVPHDQALDACRRHFRSLKDPTLPLVSLLAGRRIGARLRDVFGAAAIEDLPLPYLCVSTNLSRAAQAVHERGPLVAAIRASISLPGVLPPARIGADLHVDGGLVNNLPIDVMAARPELGAVIAVDVGGEQDMSAPPGFEPELSGWRVLWERFAPRAGRARPPTIMSVLTRSSFVASLHWARERHAADLASLYIRVPVADLRLLAFDRIDEIAARGYAAAREPVAQWWRARRGG